MTRGFRSLFLDAKMAPRYRRKGLNRNRDRNNSGQLDSLVPGRRKWRRSRKFVLEIPMGSRGRGRERRATIRVDPALRPIHPLLAPLTTLEPYLADNSSFACSKLSTTWRYAVRCSNEIRAQRRFPKIVRLLYANYIQKDSYFPLH